MEEGKVKRSIKELIKKNDKKSATILAKEMVRSKKAKERLYTSRATLNSVSMQLQQQLSMAKIAGTMQRSTQVMDMMNNLVKLPQLHATMMAMSQEMTKAGLLEEMIDEAIEDEDLDEAAGEEVEKIILGLTQEVLSKGAKVPSHALPAPAATEEPAEEKEDDLTARLNALRQ
jgi:charged multivesicular body protein 3